MVSIGLVRSPMVRIPGGSFWMGTDEEAIETKYAHLSPRIREMMKAETPRRRVEIPPFQMDRSEVTNRQFYAFRKIRPPKGLEDYPATNVSWHDAMAFAVWAGKRLPTEA